MSVEVITRTSLTINGVSVVFEPGMTILQAAEAAGIDIPNLCAHPHLKPFGRCRLCLVEVEGLRGYPSACTTPATADAVVRTESEELAALRRGALELILTEHPTGCLLCSHDEECLEHHGCHSRRAGTVTGCRFCPNDQQCELQAMVERLGITDLDLEVSYRGLPVDRRDPFFDRDYNLCILCARCVRVCDERRDAQAVALTFRGPRASVGTAYDRRLLETECQFCGECVDVCPTGALAERVNKWVGPPTAAVATTCPFCSLGCRIELRVRDGQVIGARPVEGEQLCAKGRFAVVEMALPAGRILRPQVRRDGRLVAASWDEALAAAAACCGDRLTVYASRDLLDHDLRAIAALAGAPLRALLVGDAEPLPELGPPVGSLDEVESAELLIAVGLDLRFSHTPIQLALARAAARGAALLVIGNRPGDLDRRASLHLRPELGRETALLDALGAVTRGEAEVAGPWSAAAEELLGRRPAVIVWDSGLAARDDGWALTAALGALAEALDARVLPVVDGANWRGACDLGLVAGRADLPAVAGEARPLLSFGRPPLAVRPTSGFWVACTHLVGEVTATADVVLPLAVPGEEEGTLRDVFGRERRVTAALPPAGESWPVASICEALVARAGAPVEGLPPQPAEPPGARRGSAARPAGRVLLLREYSRFNWRGQALADRVPGLLPLAAENVLRIHPEDAAALELRDGDAVRIGPAEQPVDTTIRVSPTIPPGTARLVVPPECEIGGLGPPLALALGPNPGLVTISPLLTLTGDG